MYIYICMCVCICVCVCVYIEREGEREKDKGMKRDIFLSFADFHMLLITWTHRQLLLPGGHSK